MPFQKHKRFFTKLRGVFMYIFPFCAKILSVRGFYLDVSGKISASGNSRKKRYIISTGLTNFSSYKYKVAYTKYLVRTPAGSLGLTTALSFN
jgi:hypothetical protein